jgi:hypothetical protein
MKMDIYNFQSICLPIMDEFHPMIYLFNPIDQWNSYVQKWHSSMSNHSSMDKFIHVKIILSYKKLQVQSSKLKFYAHAQAIL